MDKNPAANKDHNMGSLFHLTSIYNAYLLHSTVVSRQIATGRCLTNKEVTFVRAYTKRKRSARVNYFGTLCRTILYRREQMSYLSDITESGALKRLGIGYF